MPAADYYAELHFEFGDFPHGNPGPLVWNVLDSANAQLGGIGINMTSFPPGWQGTWYNPALNSGLGLSVPHILTQAHTQLAEATEIDGVALNFNPAAPPGYVAAMAGRDAQFFDFGLFGGAGPGLIGPMFIDRFKIGTAPGLADYLDYTAATDGFGPFTLTGGSWAVVAGRLVFPAPFGGLARFNFTAPWPPPPPPVPVFTFRVSFSVGVTFPIWQTQVGAPPLDLGTVQGALPQTLLQEGFRIELGVYDEFGAPLPSGSVKDATLAFSGLEEMEEEPQMPARGALSWPFPWEFFSGPSGSRVILVSTQGGPIVTYTVGGDDSLGIEAISVDVDMGNATGDSFAVAALLDQTGAQLARVQTGAQLSAGWPCQVTFAPNLPDSATAFIPPPVTQIQTGLWNVEAEPQSVVQLEALGPGAIITQARILCFNVSGPSGDVSKPELVYTWGG